MAFYVSAQHRGRSELLLGPFNRHGDALRMVAAASHAASNIDKKSFSYRYGTCHVRRGTLPAGILNKALGFPCDGSRITLPDPPKTKVDPKRTLYGRGPAPAGFAKCDGNRDGCVAEDEPHFHQVVAA